MKNTSDRIPPPPTRLYVRVWGRVPNILQILIILFTKLTLLFLIFITERQYMNMNELKLNLKVKK